MTAQYDPNAPTRLQLAAWAAQSRHRPFPNVPRSWEPNFVGPLPHPTHNFYDPRTNEPGRTYWGD
jgi:hypothetical protein